MVVLFLVFEVQSKSLSLVQDCIVGHMVQVWDHQVVHHIVDQVLDHRIVDQVQKIFHPIQVILKLCLLSEIVFSMLRVKLGSKDYIYTKLKSVHNLRTGSE